MAITKLDSNVALVLIDLQKGVIGLPTAHPVGEIVARAARLARAFRESGLPVVLVNVTGLAPGRTEVGIPKFAFPEGRSELALGRREAGISEFAFRRAGAILLRNWSSSPAIFWSASSGLGRSSAHPWIVTCGRAE